MGCDCLRPYQDSCPCIPEASAYLPVYRLYVQQYRDPAQMVESFKHSELAEVESMRALRAKNMEKHRQEDSGEIKYCLCRKGPSGFMFQCELCKDWFHGMLSQLPSIELN